MNAKKAGQASEERSAGRVRETKKARAPGGGRKGQGHGMAKESEGTPGAAGYRLTPVEQIALEQSGFDLIKTFLGDNYFVHNEDHILRACCGVVYLCDMSLSEFYSKSAELRRFAE